MQSASIPASDDDAGSVPPAGAPRCSIGEEIANGITHGLGALLSIAGLVILTAAAATRGPPVTVVSYAIFGASLVVLYTMSTVYHSIQDSGAKQILEIIDHSSIYLLIAGSYTAFSLGVVGGRMGWIIFSLEWAIAAVGIALKAVFLEKMKKLTVPIYIVMGWLIVFAWKPLVAGTPRLAVAFLFIGGVAYSAGTLFYAMKRVKWMHTVWHLFVIAGSVCHFFAALYALPV
ncbi:MAG: hemolysin III family protein [Spirochaetes bacterium]|nr:hemolysin III family protein [Spirochaetota bacterium]